MTTLLTTTENPFIEKARRQNPFIARATRPKRHYLPPRLPASPEEMLELLRTLSDEELQEMLDAQRELEQRLREFGPRDDDELHSWIKEELGLDIPRTPVCEEHDAPFTFIADLYFERVDAALAMANRGGGKTLLVAVLHWINSLFKPGCESFTFGATEAQSLRCYAHLKGWIYDKDGNKKPEVVSSLMRETTFANGSKLEVAPGCLPPHAQVITPEGNKRIGEIVSKRLPGPVKSFNFKTNEFEWCEITDWHNNGKGTDWLKFELEISTLQGPSDLYCTGGHRLVKIDGSKAHAVEFDVGDELVVQGRVMSEQQEQILTGMLLGDGSISTGNRYRVCHAAHQLGYLEWFADSFSEFDPYWSRRQAKNTFDVDLKCSRRFTELRREWYADGSKRIPDHIWRGLDDLGLACWLMDDGTWTRGGSGRQNQDGAWSICAMNFNAHEREQAQGYFDRRGVEGGWIPINREKDQWIWRTTGNGGAVLQSLVADHIDISEKQAKGYKRWIAGHISEHSFESIMPARIKAIKRSETEQSRYDITVPPNANYVVSSGLVISNTPAAVNGPHPSKAHSDEVELMDEATWREAQPIDTPIATPLGWKNIGDLRLGDFVLGRDGKPTRVIKIRDYGENQVYRVRLTDGRETECCGDHLWTVAGASQRRRGVWKVMKTSEMIKSGFRLPTQFKFAIPHAEAVDYESDHLPIHPYVLGVLLGDGYLGGGSPVFRSADPEIVERVDQFLGDDHFVSTSNNQHMICRADSEHGFKTLTAEVGIDQTSSFTKFIPDRYKFSSRRDRLELIRGLLDTDGCAMQGSSVAQYATVSERLAKDLREIVFSLGGRAILRKKDFSSEWSSGVIYTLDISFADGTMPFALTRKVIRMTTRQRTLHPSIKSIEPSRRVLVRCIGVDNSDSTYLTTDYIVTHNSRNMTQSQVLRDGRTIKAQDIGTSTRKGPNGRMQKLIDEIVDAINQGYKPPRKLYTWCIKETAAQVPNCQVANPDLPEDAKCQCHRIRKGEWPLDSENDRPRPRLLRDICKGDFYRSRGWQPFSDVIKQFTENDAETFEVQQLCLKPEMQYHYLPTFTEKRHCIRNFKPDPRNGPIFQAVDWGGTNPHAVNWYQLLKFEIDVEVWIQDQVAATITRRIPEGSIICFDEIYKAEIGNDRLGQLVKLKESAYRREWGPSWVIEERFADPQGKAARLDWKNIGLRTTWHVTREFEEHIKDIKDIFDADRFYVDGGKCPMWVREAKEWRRHPVSGQQIDTFNHCMSNFRYAVANILRLTKRKQRATSEVPDGIAIRREAIVTTTIRKPGSGPLGFQGAQDEFERWRSQLGQPVRQAI